MTTYFLKVPDEVTARAALVAAGYANNLAADGFVGQYCTRFTLADGTACQNHTPGARRHDVDVVGVIHERTGVDAEGNPTFTPVPGFHVNLSAPFLHEALVPYEIPAPATPARAPL